MWQIAHFLYQNTNKRECSEIAQLVDISAEELGALDVISLVNLLVLGMRPVVARSHRQEYYVLPRRLLQGQGDRDGPTYVIEKQLW